MHSSSPLNVDLRNKTLTTQIMLVSDLVYTAISIYLQLSNVLLINTIVQKYRSAFQYIAPLILILIEPIRNKKTAQLSSSILYKALVALALALVDLVYTLPSLALSNSLIYLLLSKLLARLRLSSTSSSYIILLIKPYYSLVKNIISSYSTSRQLSLNTRQQKPRQQYQTIIT